MDNLTHKPASKLLVMANNVVASNLKFRKVFQRNEHSEAEERAYGVLNSDIQHLQETAEKASKAGQP